MAETNLRVLRPNSTRSFTDFVGNGDLVDTYLFRINDPTNFNLSLTGMAQNANVQLFRDVNRNGIIDQADGAAIASSSRLGAADDFINTQLRGGNYIARVARVGNSNVNYTLRLSNQGTGPSNLLPTEINARRLTVTPFSRRDSLSITDTADTYRFTMSQVGNFNASLTGIQDGSNFNMRLIRDLNDNGVVDAGEQIVRATSAGNHDESLNVRSLGIGNYILQTYLASGRRSNYTLRMSNTQNSPSNLLAQEISAGILSNAPFSRSDTLGTNDAADNYRFRLNADSNFYAAATGIAAGHDIDMRLIRDANNNGIVDNGEEIIRASNSGNVDEAFSVESLAAGNYILQSYLVSGTSSGYTLGLSTNSRDLVYDELDAGTLTNTPYVHTDGLNALDATDNYRFTLNAPGNFNAALTGIPVNSNFDMRLIRDANGNRVVDNTDVLVTSAASSNSDDAINVRSLAAGQYFLQTYLVTGSGNYTLKMSNTGDLPGNLLAVESDNVPLNGAEIPGNLSTNNASNTYHFTLAGVSDFNATVTDIEVGNNIDIRLIQDANNNGIVDDGDQIVQAKNNGNADDAINVQSLAAGSYILQTYLFAGTDSDYTLRMSNSLNNLLVSEINAGTLPADSLASPFNRSDSLSVNDATDTYRFRMEASGHFNAALTGITAGNNFDMRLIRDNGDSDGDGDGDGIGIVDPGDVLVSAQAIGNSDDAINMRSLAVGDYFLQVYRSAGDGGNYNLKMSNTGLDPVEPSNLLPTEVDVGTVSITTPATRTGSLSATNASDIFRFNVTSSSIVTLTLSGLSVDADLRLIRDSNNDGIVSTGDEISRSSNSGISNETIGYTIPPLGAGNYFAQVFLVPDEGAMNTNYSLGITAVSVP